MKPEVFGFVGSLIFIVFDAVYGKNCYNSEEHPQTFQCEHGCCGNKYQEYCCQITTQIIGSVLGGLIVIGVIIGVAIFCCKKKQKRQPGTGTGILGRLGMRSNNTNSAATTTAPPPLTRDPVTGRPIPVPVPHRRHGRIPQPRSRQQPNAHCNPAYVSNMQMQDIQPPVYYPQPTGPLNAFPVSPTAPMPPPYEMTTAPPPYAFDKSVPPPPAYNSVITSGYKPVDYNGGMPPPAD